METNEERLQRLIERAASLVTVQEDEENPGRYLIDSAFDRSGTLPDHSMDLDELEKQVDRAVEEMQQLAKDAPLGFD